MASSAKIRPSDCALLVGVPLSREDFLGDLSRADKDYAISIKENRESENDAVREYATAEGHWMYYEPIARLVEWHCREAEKLGATVMRNATLSDLANAVRRFRVVTLAAHWRFTLLHPEDVFDRARLVDILRTPNTATQEFLASRLRRTIPDVFDNTSEPQTCGGLIRIVDAINNELEIGHSYYRRNPFTDREGDEGELIPLKSLDRFTKIRFERAFSDCVTPLPAVELFDRMCTTEEVVNALPDSFDGTIDLTICNSVVLGQAIKAAREKCVVAVSRYKVEPIPRFRNYLTVLRSLARNADSYRDALTEVYTR